MLTILIVILTQTNPHHNNYTQPYCQFRRSSFSYKYLQINNYKEVRTKSNCY